MLVDTTVPMVKRIRSGPTGADGLQASRSWLELKTGSRNNSPAVGAAQGRDSDRYDTSLLVGCTKEQAVSSWECCAPLSSCAAVLLTSFVKARGALPRGSFQRALLMRSAALALEHQLPLCLDA